MNFIDEKNLTFSDRGEYRRYVTGALERWSTRKTNPCAYLFCNDVGKCCLAESGRSSQKNVIGNVPAFFRG